MIVADLPRRTPPTGGCADAPFHGARASSPDRGCIPRLLAAAETAAPIVFVARSPVRAATPLWAAVDTASFRAPAARNGALYASFSTLFNIAGSAPAWRAIDFAAGISKPAPAGAPATVEATATPNPNSAF